VGAKVTASERGSGRASRDRSLNASDGGSKCSKCGVGGMLGRGLLINTVLTQAGRDGDRDRDEASVD